MPAATYKYDKDGANHSALIASIKEAGLPLDDADPLRDNRQPSPTDNLTIGMTATLDAGQETTLAGIIAAHDPDTATTGMRLGFSYYAAQKLSITGSWKVFSSFLWAGTSYFGKQPKQAQVVAARVQGSSQYSIRLYDVTNNAVLCEVSGLDNTNPVIHDMGALAVFPADDAIVEIQLRRDGSGSTKVSVDAAQVLF